MTIGIAIAVPDGIALAADTQTTWNLTITKAKDKATGNDFELAEPIQMPVGWSRLARKLFSLEMGDKTYALVTAGPSGLNSKSMYSVFRSGATQYGGDGSCGDVSSFFAQYLKSEMAKQYSCKEEELSKQPLLVCEYILAGYEEGDVAKPFLESHIVFSGKIVIDGKSDDSGHRLTWTNVTEPIRTHGCWIGQTAFISHLVKHSNPGLPQISGQFHMMTLADAVDYTRFLVGYTCDFQRFAVMVPNCGRPITSSILTPEAYKEETVP
jgi:hypothetical protein